MRQIGKRQRWNGTTQTWFEDADGTQVFRTEGDFSELYRQNQEKRNGDSYKAIYVPDDDWRGREVADIDPMTILRWKQDGFDFFDYSNPDRGKELSRRLRNEPWLLTTDKRFELK